MSTLSVSLEELNTVAQETDSIHSQTLQLRVTPALSSVNRAIPGGQSGLAADRAGDAIDADTKSLAEAIESFAQAIRQSRKNYSAQDSSSSVDFSKVNALLEGRSR